READDAQVRLGEERTHSGGGTVIRLTSAASSSGTQPRSSRCPVLGRQLQVALARPIGQDAHQLVEVLARLDLRAVATRPGPLHAATRVSDEAPRSSPPTPNAAARPLPATLPRLTTGRATPRARHSKHPSHRVHDKR